METSPGRMLTTAAVQLQCTEDVESNLKRCEAMLERAATAGAQLVVLPENFAYFGEARGRAEFAEVLGSPGPIQDFLSESSARHGIAIVAGGMPERNPEDLTRPYNTAVLFDRDGGIVDSYRKIHLFDVELPDGRALCESASTSPGNAVRVVEVMGVRLGLTICYDVRFSSLFEAIADAGADMVVVPAAFTVPTGQAHWHTLMRARAIEFQLWVVAAGQWGEHPENRQTYGHSLIVDPWGDVIAELDAGEGVVLATVDTTKTWQVRNKIPCLQHRRLARAGVVQDRS